jgi:hypothetical protein
MSVNETRRDSFSAKVDFLRKGSRKIQHIRITANSKKPAAYDGNSLGARLLVVHGQDVAVVKNEFWFFLFERKERKGSKCAEKFAASGSIDHRAP